MSNIFETIGKIGGGVVGAYFGGPAGAAVGSSVGGAVGGAIDGDKKDEKVSSTTQNTQSNGNLPLINNDTLKLAMSLLNQAGSTSNATGIIESLGGGSNKSASSGAIDLVSKLFT